MPSTPMQMLSPHKSLKLANQKNLECWGYLGPCILGIIPTKVLGAPSVYIFIELTKMEKLIVHADPQKCFKVLLIF